MKKICLIIPILLVLFFTACRKDLVSETTIDLGNDPTIITYTPEVESGKSSIIGFVTNQYGQPVTDASVTLDNLNTTTNEDGIFQFTDITVNQKGTLVKVRKNGYFHGSRRFFPRDEKKHQVNIELVKEIVVLSFNAEEGGTIEIEEGVTVTFPENSIIDANGNAYTGNVYTASTWLDPSNPSTFKQMPGNLQGISASSGLSSLQSYGMLNVELRSNQNHPLSIKEGHKATITATVPENMIANAPDKMPLWSFNETYGLWVEESTATLQGNKYIGEVAHFSWWNLDVPYPLVSLDLTLINNDNRPVSSYSVGIGIGDSPSFYGITDNQGFISGMVPQDQPLTLTILGVCGEVIETIDLGVLSTNTSLGNIVVQNSQLNNTVIEGSAYNCDNELINNGWIVVNQDNHFQVFPFENGSIDIDLSSCGNSNISFKVVNITNGLASLTYNVVSGQSNTYADITVCETTFDESYIRLDIGEISYYYPIDPTLNMVTFWESGNGSSSLEFTTKYQQNGMFFEMIIDRPQLVGDYSNPINYYEHNKCTLVDTSSNGLPNFILKEPSGTYGSIYFSQYHINQNNDIGVTGQFSDSLINILDVNQETVYVRGEFFIKNP